jgi:hypothetical protein
MAGTTRAFPTASSLLRASSLFALALALESCPSSPQPFAEVFDDSLPAGLLSVWGTSARDVWTVGGDPGDGPLVLHFDGSQWRRLATAQTGDLWWVHGFVDGPVFLGGEAGMILRYEGGSFTRETTPAAGATVFGIWGTSPTDLWAVGGSGGSAGFVWHRDAAGWSAVTTPAGFSGAAVFKVWGTRTDEVWLCGGMGTLMHWDGAALAMVPTGTTRTLLTIHAIEGATAAVGGAGSAVIVEPDAAGAWHDVTPAIDAEGTLPPQLMGVWLTGPTTGFASGIYGTVMRRSGGAWALEDTGLALAEALHSVWVDPDGGVWAAGGDVLTEPLRNGILLYRGDASVGNGTFTN